MAQSSARELAVAALTEWRRTHRFADAILQQRLAESRLGTADRAFATELFYGVLRNRTLLDFWIGQLRSSALDSVSRDLLRVGLYQLFILRTPGHAAVFETVALAPQRQRGLINAVLRTAQRRLDELHAAAAGAPLSVRRSHPEFLIERWTKAFGADAAAALCEWNNQPAPIYARVNSLKMSVEEFIAAIPSAKNLTANDSFVRITEVPLEAVARGECYIQDPSTAIACELLDPQPGDMVLDACAAPGGKTALLAQLMQNRGELVASERDSRRVSTLRENLDRLGASVAHAVQHDWRSGAALSRDKTARFDRILVDAPCTNTGVLRRRVDARWRLTPADFLTMQNQQVEILRAVAPWLKPRGTLVYSTCSIEADENEQVIEHLTRELPFLQLRESRSVLPFRDQFDGVYAARLVRVS